MCNYYATVTLLSYIIPPPLSFYSVVPKFSATNIKMTSVYTMLRLCSNHPYLLEFPLTPSGDFKVDEELVQCAGKIQVLDRLLTALIKDGHKVSTVWCMWGGNGAGKFVLVAVTVFGIWC